MSGRFVAALDPGPSVHRPLPSRVLLGLEHEYSLFDGARQIGFRSLLDRSDIGVPRLTPDDPGARWCGGGLKVTADGQEAEVAISPVVLASGFADRIVDRARLGAAALRSLLPTGSRFVGYSTHVSVATPAPLLDTVAVMFARRFAPAAVGA